jgi:hypothetical protein
MISLLLWYLFAGGVFAGFVHAWLKIDTLRWNHFVAVLAWPLFIAAAFGALLFRFIEWAYYYEGKSE